VITADGRWGVDDKETQGVFVMGKRLYVGNLAYEVTSTDLEGLFAQAGSCQSARVLSDRDTGRSRGFGFVEMASNEEALKAIEQFNGQEFMGRALKVNEAREESRGGGSGGNRGGGFGNRDGGGGGFGGRGGGGGGGGGRGGWGRR
jgi:cold-inducible RNA-binding protein